MSEHNDEPTKEDKMLAHVSDIVIIVGQYKIVLTLNLLLYLLIAAIVGLVAEAIVGWRVPFGIIGAVIFALVGMWLMTNIIIIKGLGDYTLYGVPLIRTFIGAAIMVIIWHLITGGFASHRAPRPV
jgi:uncharacterized membrane protein YeaQ/YmgE (transglycosylase-associated protein family)